MGKLKIDFESENHSVLKPHENVARPQRLVFVGPDQKPLSIFAASVAN